MVHPHILADAADEIVIDEVKEEVKEREPPPSPSGSPPPGGLPPSPSAISAPQREAPAGAAAEPLTLASLAASLANVTSLVQQLLQAQPVPAAAAGAGQAAGAPASSPSVPPASPPSVPPAPPNVAPVLPYVPFSASPPVMPALISPPPHRAAVLDRAAVASQGEIAALVNRFSALRDDGDSDAEDMTVPTQPHTRTTLTSPPAAAGILPQAFVPPPIGAEQSPTQQLAAIFNALNKQGGKVKYSTIEELDEALDDWAADALKSGRTAQQVESIRAYQRLLTKQFAISDRMPLKQVLEYHRLWCKAVHAGTIDLFSQGAAMNHDIYYAVTHPLRLTAQGSVSSSSQAKDNKFKASDKAASDKVAKPKAKHAPGSCTHHPTSTSHTTAECIKKGGQ
jgi:hypothetical protein